ncbi:MAG: hypothetical protein GXO20_07545 [Thermodesulfobacteria bacterium]|nr:hypothetical protein [Thermodesulfobacteriota bacterium]
MRIVGSGALNLDFFYEIEDLKMVETVPLIPGGECWGSRAQFERLREELEKKGRFIAKSGGGSAANTIYALKNWGFPTGFIGLAGRDLEGEEILAELEGADLSRVLRQGESACCLIVLDARKDRAIFVAPHSQESLLERYEAHTTPQEWLHLSSLVTPQGFSFHLRLKRSHAGPSSIDPGEIYARKGWQKLHPLLKASEVLFLTAQELAILKVSPEELSSLARYVFLKRGREGATLWNGNPRDIAPAAPEKVVDNTGAGDVFDAGVLAGLLSGLEPFSAGRLGAHLAALSLRDYGRRGYPSREEFESWRRFYDTT